MSSVVLLPLDPVPPPPGAVPTLAAVERETAARLGPFYWLQATAGTASTIVVESARSNAPIGGYEGLWALRRDAVRAADRVRTVDRVDGPSGSLVVDFPYEDAPVAGEWVELHHLHPDQQLRTDVLAGLRRCYLLDSFEVPPPAGAYAYANGNGYGARAVIREVNGNGNGPWLVLPQQESGPPVVSSFAQPALQSGGSTVADLTAVAFWLTSARQILGVAVNAEMIPQLERWGRASGGWSAYANRGRVYLAAPGGAVAAGPLEVRAYRDAFGIVGGLDDPRGPTDDDDELAVPVEYAAALAHIEAWRRHSDRLEASAAEGRFATQEMAAAEASRCAAKFADFLFRPQTERGDSIASPWSASRGGGSVNGLGGTGALAGAVVNRGW